MATEIVMPKLGMTMVEGTVKAWLVPDGTAVRPGQPLYQLTTEKIDMEVEAEVEGTLRHAVAAGGTVPAGAIVAYILAAGEQLPAGAVTAASPAAAAAPAPVAAPATTPGTAAPVPRGPAPRGADGWVRAAPAARRLARELGVDLALVSAGADGVVHEAQVRAFHAQPAPAVAAAPSVGEVRASPLARRLAEQHGIDLHTVRGSGPGGRIVQEDIERLIAAGPATPPPATTPAHVHVARAAEATRSTAAPSAETVPFTGMRRTIAQRMHGSLQEMAQLTIFTDADVTELVRLRTQLVEEWQRDGVRPTYTDLVVKASAKALREHPRLNASLEGDVIRLHADIHVAFAVALDEGLIVPVIRSTDRTPLKRLARISKDLAERARINKLTFDEVTGGTFSVTSLGMFDVDGFTPIVNPPQVAILGVGRIRETVALAGKEVVAKQALTLSLSFDHRVVDGAPAAEFLRRVRQLLERPYLLLVEDE